VTWLLLAPALIAQAPEIVSLGSPCQARNVLAGRIVADRATGHECLVLANMNEGAGTELIFIDLADGTARSYTAPAGAGSWALLEVPGDRLIVGTFYDGAFMCFDLRKMAFTQVAKFPGESYIWNLSMGSDGRVYGGTYPGGKLGALDLNTFTVEDCGAPAPPNLYLRNVSATPDGRILCQLGMEQPTTVLYDPARKAFSPVPETLKGVSIGVSWNGHFLAGQGAWAGPELDAVTPPPYLVPPDAGGWAVDTYVTTEDTLYLRQGPAVWRYRADTGLVKVMSADLRGGRLLAGAPSGAVAGVRGQDYFVARPGETGITLQRIPGESAPRPIHFLRLAPDGKLWGGPPFGQTLFSLDPGTGKAVNTATICDAGGEVYDAAFHGGCVYAAAYSGGDIVRYDPSQPWDQWGSKNPVTIASVGRDGFIRPTGGIVVGPDGLLYSGWMAAYGAYGGAVAATNPTTGETRLIRNPLGEQAVEGLAVGDGVLYVGTSLGANGLPTKEGESTRFGVVDAASGAVLFQREFAGASGVGAVYLDAATGLVSLAVNGRPMLFDPTSRQFSDIGGEPPGLGCHSVAAPGNGRLYYGSGEKLVEVGLGAKVARVAATLGGAITNVAGGADGIVYASCGAEVFRVKVVGAG
jgi:hypothetical protein